MEMHIMFLFMAFFVPFLPAYCIYKKLPSDIIVKGPFKGFNINLTGAFGGYFLLVLLALSFAYFSLTPSKPCYEVWDLTGRIKVESTEPNIEKEFDYVKDTEIGMIPPNIKVGSNGKFTMKIIVEPGHVEGKSEFPAIMFNLPGYVGPQLILDMTDENISFAEKTKLIRLTQPVVLGRLPEKTEEPKWDL